MVKLSINIESNNAGLKTQSSVTAAVKAALERIKNGQHEGKVLDVNGNSVGTFVFESTPVKS